MDPAKVPPSGVRARCSVCGGVISIPTPTGHTTPPAGTAQSGTSASASSSPSRPRSTPQAADSWDPPPFNSTSQRTPAAPPARPVSSPVSSHPPAPRTAEAPATARPRPESSERATIAATATPPSPTTGLPEFTPPASIPPFTPPGSSLFTPPSAPPFVPGTGRPPTPPRTPGAPTPASAATGEGGPRRPLNPFLSKDPNQRAKRLARALVSDIITYHPAKHAEGLRDGTLKQLFREEIKKSFEEYIAQVGQQLAESTTYFQEALNEVLGAGKKIF
ncbi:MAG: hypothetical protein M3P12_08680 [Gemmatimonadota bacterium]|nr:hypothetical protein [Gemmatimonadota bacterium]